MDLLAEEHLKAVTREHLLELVTCRATMLLAMESFEEVVKHIEMVWLEICFKCFSNPSLSRRILAIDLVSVPCSSLDLSCHFHLCW